MFFPKLTRRPVYTGAKGIYGHRRFRMEVAEDCLFRCCYCDCPQDEIGGDPMMELDHLRPESIFDSLKDVPTNLVYACRSCNGKKRHDWPAGADDCTYKNGVGYLDPFVDDRAAYFRVHPNGTIESIQPPAAYIISRLALDRPLLRRLRYRRLLTASLKSRLEQAIVRFQKKLPNLPEDQAADYRELLEIMRIQLECL